MGKWDLLDNAASPHLGFPFLLQSSKVHGHLSLTTTEDDLKIKTETNQVFFFLHLDLTLHPPRK